MGGCGSTSSDSETSKERQSRTRMVVSSQMQNPNNNSNSRNTLNSKKNQINPNDAFGSFPELEGDYWFGQGIRRVKGYKCELTFDQLANKRKEFWESKNKYKRVWLALKECCEADHHETACQLLMVAELVCIGDNMMHVQDVNTCIDFFLPNWVITDPEVILDYTKKANEVNSLKTSLVKLYLNNVQIQISNKSKGSELKQAYLIYAKLNPSENNVRVFHRGKEIEDDHFLCYHDIENESRLMVNVRRLENEEKS